MKKRLRNFITVYIPNRRKQGIQEPTPIPEGIEPKKLPKAYLEGYMPEPSVKSKGSQYMASWRWDV